MKKNAAAKEKFGELLLQLIRRKKRLNQSALAGALRVSATAVSNWCKGDDLPSDIGVLIEALRDLKEGSFTDNDANVLSDAYNLARLGRINRDDGDRSSHSLIANDLNKIINPAAAEYAVRSVETVHRIFFGVPPRMPGFVGRDAELEVLETSLQRDRHAAITQLPRTAVQGMGGVGKTSIATEYAHRSRGYYHGTCWCPSETRTRLLTSLAALAAELGCARKDMNVEEAAKAALSWLAQRSEPWLLIYDNVPGPREIADLLPAGAAHVVITSRFLDWSGWAGEVALDMLPMESALALLQERAGREDEAGARLLAEALGRLPLALDHAAATCRRAQMSFTSYTEMISDFMDNAPRGRPYPISVAATFNLAIDEAIRHNASAEKLMALLGRCAPERVPIQLLQKAFTNIAEYTQGVSMLVELSLVKNDPFADGAPAIVVHRLVLEVARARSALKRETEVVANMFLKLLAEAFPISESHDDHLASALATHAAINLESSDGVASGSQCVLAWKLARYIGFVAGSRKYHQNDNAAAPRALERQESLDQYAENGFQRAFACCGEAGDACGREIYLRLCLDYVSFLASMGRLEEAFRQLRKILALPEHERRPWAQLISNYRDYIRALRRDGGIGKRLFVKSGNIGIVLNGKGRLCIVYDAELRTAPISAVVDWSANKIGIIDGFYNLHLVDWEISNAFHEPLMKSERVLLIRIEQRKAVEGYDVRLIKLASGKIVNV